MNGSAYKKAENIFVSKTDKKEFKLLSLLVNAFDYEMDFVVRQIIQNSSLFEKAYSKYGINIIERSYNDACDELNERISKNDKDKKKIISVDDWIDAINAFINSQVNHNIEISWFVQALNIILNLCPDGITIGVEHQYVDRIYRDSYYIHIGGEHFNKSRFCNRLVIFNGDQRNAIKNVCVDNIKCLQKNFIGSMVIRPIKEKSIGRCLLNPFYFRQTKDEMMYVRVSEYNISYCGIRLFVKAFPFEMQDGITTTCAEVTLLNLLDYYSNEFQDYQFAVPSTLKQIIKKLSADRVTPATGISYEDISRVLYQSGFTPKFYRVSHNISYGEIIQMISFYVESGIPVAIGMNKDETKMKRGHSIICIGHKTISNEQIINFVKNNTPNSEEIKKIVKFDHNDDNECEDNELSLKKQTVICKKTQDGEVKTLHRVFSYAAIDQYIIQDDLMRPYNTMKPDIKCGTLTETATNDKWYINCIVAPLYKRMHMDARQARTVVDQILISKLGPINKGMDINSCIVVRLFLASSKNLQEHRVMTIQNPKIKSLYRSTPYPQFVWVAELYDIAEYPNNEAFGEIILDATNAEGVGLDSVIMINYNSRHLSRDRDGINITQENKADSLDSSDINVLPGSFNFGIFKSIDECTYKPYNHNLLKFPDEKTNGSNQ